MDLSLSASRHLFILGSKAYTSHGGDWCAACHCGWLVCSMIKYSDSCTSSDRGMLH